MNNNEITAAAEQKRAELLDVRINANAQVMASSMAEMGRDLKTMRDEQLYKTLGCGTFEEYCNEMTPIKQRMAYNFIKCWEKYGDDLEELSRVGITKLTLMTALDDEERGELIESGDAERLTTRELEKRVKELLNKNEQLTLKLDEKSKEENAAEVLKQQIERLNTELEAAKAVQNQQKERADMLEKQNEELSKRPVDVAVEKPSKAELDKIAKSAAKKAEEAAKKQYDKDIALLRKRMAEAEKANAEKLERLEKEKAALQRFAEHNAANAKKPQPTSQKERVKLHIEECLRNFNEALEDIGALPEDDRANVIEKLKNMADRMKEMLSDE